jgi:hypothetical protein
MRHRARNAADDRFTSQERFMMANFNYVMCAQVQSFSL